jgi:serine/threonine-protein kinase
MLAEPTEDQGVQSLPHAVVTQPRRAVLPWSIAALAIIVASAIGWRATRPPERPMMRFSAELGPDAIVGGRTTVAISPDGTRIVYPVRSGSSPIHLATRLMDQSKATVLPGTEEARDPFFSPNGQWIGFFAADKLKKISVQGGTAVTLCDIASAAGDRGASWGEDGAIIAALDLFHLFRVPEAGGAAARLPVKADDTGETAYRWPQILPGCEAVLASVGVVGAFEDATIAVVSLKNGDVKKVLTGGYYARYLPTGHLIYLHQGTLFAAPFDLRRMEIYGTPVRFSKTLPATASTEVGRSVSQTPEHWCT